MITWYFGPPDLCGRRLAYYLVEVEQETDGRWIAEIPELPGVLVYGDTREAAIGAVEVLALHVLADHLAHGELSTSPSISYW